jgi:hypothetical protein
MAGLVYLLCAATSLTCAVLLLRGFKRTRAQLLLWSGLCFLFLTAQNVLLYVDVVLVPQQDLSIPRELPALAGLLLLIYGLIWESR